MGVVYSVENGWGKYERLRCNKCNREAFGIWDFDIEVLKRKKMWDERRVMCREHRVEVKCKVCKDYGWLMRFKGEEEELRECKFCKESRGYEGIVGRWMEKEEE